MNGERSEYPGLSPHGINSRGGRLTITNARIWTGDPKDPWKTAMTVRDGKIVAMDGSEPAGEVIDAGGRLVVPGFCDGHCHPQVPFVAVSPGAPMLFKAESVREVQDTLRDYVRAHPEDKYPRMFGWTGTLFREGQKPTRELLDEVVSDRPVYLAHEFGHYHWANTKALELAGVLEKDPAPLPGFTGHVERDPETGLATGYLTETELGATIGILLQTVKAVQPYSFEEQVYMQRCILDMYPRVGVTSIWTKDGDLEMTRIYEAILRSDSLPVRAVLDNLYSPFSAREDLELFAARAQEIEESDLPKGFLRADGVKLILDLPAHMWMLEPYAGGVDGSGHPAFEMGEFRRQVFEADRLGLKANLLTLGDRAVREGLNVLEELQGTAPPRARRHTLEHVSMIQDQDIPRIKELGAVAVMTPIGVYPDESYQKPLEERWGKERLHKYYERWKDLIDEGVTVVSGSDFTIAPTDPLLGIHLMVTGTDLHGTPEGGLWPHKQISVEEALRSYTVNAAYASFDEDQRGMLKPGYHADFAILSENILAPEFELRRLVTVKVNLTALNGHIVHEDFSAKEKAIDWRVGAMFSPLSRRPGPTRDGGLTPKYVKNGS